MRKATKYKPRGFVHAGGLLNARIRKTSGDRGFAEARLLTQWVEIVGDSVAKIAKPIKISYARKGMGAKLTVLALGANGPELQMQVPRIIERVNACYGYSAISEVFITQTSATGFAEKAESFEFDDTPAKAEVDPVKKADHKSRISLVEDSNLRDLLEKLGNNVLLNN